MCLLCLLCLCVACLWCLCVFAPGCCCCLFPTQTFVFTSLCFTLRDGLAWAWLLLPCCLRACACGFAWVRVMCVVVFVCECVSGAPGVCGASRFGSRASFLFLCLFAGGYIVDWLGLGF